MLENGEALEQMRQIAPVARQTLFGAAGDLWAVASVPDFGPRLTCAAFVASCGGKGGVLDEVTGRLQDLEAGCTLLRSPGKLLRRCLSLCLAVGNHLNQGTNFAGARGVSLPESLLKFEDLKGCCAP